MASIEWHRSLDVALLDLRGSSAEVAQVRYHRAVGKDEVF